MDGPARQRGKLQPLSNPPFDYGSLSDEGGMQRRKSMSHVERAALAVVIFCLLLIILMAVTVALLIYQLHTNSQQQACLAPSCSISAGQILTKMDFSVDPCQDFYEYACGRQVEAWKRMPDVKGRRNVFQETTEANMAILKQALEDSKAAAPLNSAVGKLMTYYTTCMNTTAQEQQGIQPVLELISVLGSWSLTPSNSRRALSLSLEEALSELHAIGGMAFFDFNFEEDMHNTSTYLPTFGQGILTLPDAGSYSSDAYHSLLVNYIVSVGLILGGDSNELMEQAENIWQVEQQLAKIFVPQTLMNDRRKMYNKMTVQQLSDLMQNTVDIDKFLRLVIGKRVDSSMSIMVSQPSYMRMLGTILNSLDEQVIQDYIVWRGVSMYLPFMPKQLEKLWQQLNMDLFGATPAPQWEKCITRADVTLQMAAAFLFASQLGNPPYDPYIDNMVAEFKAALLDELQTWSVLDDITKSRAFTKGRAMQKAIGLSPFFQNESNLNNYYAELQLGASSPLRNELAANRLTIRRNVNLFNTMFNKDMSEMSGVTANAYYSLTHNTIRLTLGILQAPYYQSTFSKAYNYAILGSAIGHEILHGFDVSGHLYNELGNLEDWWTMKSNSAYEQLSQCFVEQYNNYTLYGKHVNGTLTLAENMADVGGLQLAQRVYEKYLQTNGGWEADAHLPGVNMTEQQVFYLSYAQHWCTYATEKFALNALDTDVHSPQKFRVNGVLSNIASFSSAFSCPISSPMNSQKKCSFF